MSKEVLERVDSNPENRPPEKYFHERKHGGAMWFTGNGTRKLGLNLELAT